jgi:hypothetical protein
MPKTEMDTLKSEIDDLENASCHEDPAQALSDRSDSVSSDLDEAEDAAL